MGPAHGFWVPFANRSSKFRVLLSGERVERDGRSVLASFLLDALAAGLWDEDFFCRSAYTRNISLQGCAKALLMLQLCAVCVFLDAGK